MKFSQSLIVTLRDAPAEAEVISHKLLIRAGFIRKLTSGIYDFLPLGLRSLRKVENIVRAEMDKSGALEIFLPHLVPAELWQQSGRWSQYGDELLRIKDRHKHEFCFGPTHEEVVCELIAGVLSSYKQLPLHVYQIQTKFRDERRPRYGLMRGREFLMKDGYSFHMTAADLEREYQVMHETYMTIFRRCGLTCRAVEADTGAIGGSSSHEFMIMADAGEDEIAVCDSCGYAANVEKANFAPKPPVAYTEEKIKEVLTPNLKNIEEVSRFLGTKAEQMIKTLLYKVDDTFVVICLSGNRSVSEVKLARLFTDAKELRLATDEEVLKVTGVPVGFLGPVGFKADFKICCDHSVFDIASGVTGANKKDFHIVNVNITRDGEVKNLTRCDVSVVLPGDACPTCRKGHLTLRRGIEVGHIFKLGTRYSEPMKVSFLDENGVAQKAIMGTYGIGIGRTLAASVEQNHDDKGIIWPRALAPFDVHLMHLDKTDAVAKFASTLYGELGENGISAFWDDRDERAGVKFNDADLIGIPLQLIVGKRGFDKGEIEFKIRRSGERGNMACADALRLIQQKLAGC